MSKRTKAGLYDYRLFGLHIRSDLVLPELPATDRASAPEVIIRLDEGDQDGAQIQIDGIARFRVTDGREIRVRPEPGASERNVRLYLLGSAMGMLLHQRGLLPLHANAVEIGGKAVAFMGPSGSGKSTLAAWLHDHGYRVIADDVCVLRFDENERPIVCPGLPRLRLWKEVLEASGRETAHYDRSYSGADDWEKYDVPLSPDAPTDGEVALAAVYLLDTGDRPAIEPIDGIKAAEAIFANTYRGRFVSETGYARLHWEACLKLVKATPLFRAVRGWNLDRIDEQSGPILDHARQIVESAS